MKTNLKIDWATHQSAKYACENWHYSKCLPSSMQKRFAVGAWENEKFIGVVVFGHGANPSIGSPYGLSIYECCELTRVALKDHQSPVSRIIRIAISFLKKSNPKIKLIVSYADSGQDHHGGIYQAGNWFYVGISKGVDRIFFNGKDWHAKALRTSFPKLKMSDSRIKKIKGTDKYKYLMPLCDEIRKRIEPLRKPYPKRAPEAEASMRSSSTREIGGSSPTSALHSNETISG